MKELTAHREQMNLLLFGAILVLFGILIDALGVFYENQLRSYGSSVMLYYIGSATVALGWGITTYSLLITRRGRQISARDLTQHDMVNILQHCILEAKTDLQELKNTIHDLRDEETVKSFQKISEQQAEHIHIFEKVRKELLIGRC